MDNTQGNMDLSHEDVWDDTLLIQQYDSSMEQLRKKAALQIPISKTSHNSSTSQAGSSGMFSSVPSGVKKFQPTKKAPAKPQWQVGAACRCEFSEDGKVYEATIEAITPSSNLATVTFVGYGNSEDIPLSKLLRSKGAAARRQQEANAAQDNDYEEEEEEEVELESGVGEDESSDCSSKLTTPKSRSSRRADSAHVTSSSTATNSRHSSFSRLSMPDGGGVLPDLPPPPPLGMSFSGLEDSEMLHTLLMSWYMTGYHTGYYRGVKMAKHRHRHH
ncbi:survival motor neuron protein-like isoform X2 [Hyalella azteca]|uniref:Survival motor neuron protein-like isoform X2 n=1 Tax=Hyalella azteca TaxID=294128 RepID=A0A8B7NRR5_HYAAZ|nr:survival motor neuron protein-like isoform X2 [Hyalella azteca]